MPPIQGGGMEIYMKSTREEQIDHNRKAHNRIVNKYGKKHKEIYNLLEQERLRENLTSVIGDKSLDYLALDYGSGEGNLTKKLLELGVTVVCADVSDRCLEFLNDTYGVDTILIDGEKLSNIEDNTYDFIGMYSVVHHIPDYISVLGELTKKLKTGGVLYIDHETCSDYWESNKMMKLNEFKKDALSWKGKIHKYLRPKNYINKLRTIFIDPHYSEEGDIHVFPDDHLDWKKIVEKIGEDCNIVSIKDYLLYNGYYNLDKYNEARKSGLTDTTCLIAEKR